MDENGYIPLDEVAVHYGYTKETVANCSGNWADEPGVLERLRLLPDALDGTREFRVVFDYDPEYPRALLQVYYEGMTRSAAMATGERPKKIDFDLQITEERRPCCPRCQMLVFEEDNYCCYCGYKLRE